MPMIRLVGMCTQKHPTTRIKCTCREVYLDTDKGKMRCARGHVWAPMVKRTYIPHKEKDHHGNTTAFDGPLLHASELEKAWLAGVLDKGGALYVKMMKKQGLAYIRLAVSNRDKATGEEVARLLGTSVEILSGSSSKPYYTNKTKLEGHRQVSDVLKLVAPYIKGLIIERFKVIINELMEGKVYGNKNKGGYRNVAASGYGLETWRSPLD